MNLEDHLGDVVRKGRKCMNTSAEAAAKAAGISEAELSALEETGKPPAKINYAGLAGVTGLSGPKLEELAKGWLPKPVNTAQWQEFRMITTSDGEMSVNCFLVWDEVTREAAVFDTGFDAKPIIALVEENKLTLKHLFITHTHEDHVAAMGPLREKYPKMHMHTNAKSAPPQSRNRANDFIQLGSLRITNRETPGHAEDGVTYIIGTWPEDAPHVAVVGDAIFAGSMGGGNQSWDLAKQKVREAIFTLPADTLICPGHGPLTTVGEEKAHNPFF